MRLLNANYGKGRKMVNNEKKGTRALSSKFMNKQIVNSKRSQFKIQQMAFMLLAVFLFFILVSLFWLAVQYRNLNKQASLLEEEKAMILSEFLSGSSEFSCSSEMGGYCIDTDKLMVLINKTVYRELWPVSFIRVRKVHPVEGEKDVECNKVSYPNCNIYKVFGYDDGTGKGSFIALCRHEQVDGYFLRKCELGKMIVGYVTKG